jgi:hypothetical protein
MASDVHGCSVHEERKRHVHMLEQMEIIISFKTKQNNNNFDAKSDNDSSQIILGRKNKLGWRNSFSD